MQLSNAEMRALQRQMAAEARAERAAVKAEKAAGEAVWKDVVDALANDDIDSAKNILARGRNVLPASVYASIIPGVVKPTVASHDTIDAMNRLTGVAMNSDAAVRDTLPQVARELLLSGGITKSTYDAYATNALKEVDSHAINVIDTYFRDMGEFDPLSAAAGGNAKNDYYTWAKNKPNATAQERYDQAVTINRQYTLVNMTKFTSQASQYLPRAALVTGGHSALVKAGAKLQQDYQNGKIDQNTYKREVAIIAKINKFMKADEAMKAANPSVKTTTQK